MKKRVWLIGCALLLCAGQLVLAAGKVSVAAKIVGNRVVVTYDIPQKMRQTLHDDLFKFDVEPVEGLSFGDVIYPETAEKEDGLAVYRGQTEIFREFKVTGTPSAKFLNVTASYQICADGGMCYMPQDVKLKVKLPEKLAAGGAVAAKTNAAATSVEPKVSHNGEYDAVSLAYNGSKIWTMDYDAGLARAVKQRKDLLVLFTGSDWCDACKSMEERILSNPEFIEKMTNDFVMIFMDRPMSAKWTSRIPAKIIKRRDELSKRLGVRSVPVIFLMSPQERVYGRMGFAPALSAENYVGILTDMKRDARKRFELEQKLVSGGLDKKAQLVAMDKIAQLVDRRVAPEDYTSMAERIISLDGDNSFGFRDKYRIIRATDSAQQAYNKGEYDKVCQIVDDAVLDNIDCKKELVQKLMQWKAKVALKQGTHQDYVKQMQSAIELDPDTKTAAKLSAELHEQQDIFKARKESADILVGLKDASIKGDDRAILLDKFLKMKKESNGGKRLVWRDKEPYVWEIMRLDADNHLGLRQAYQLEFFQVVIPTLECSRSFDRIHELLGRYLQAVGGSDQARQQLMFAQVKMKALSGKPASEIKADLKKALKVAPTGICLQEIQDYLKALENPDTNPALMVYLGPELSGEAGKNIPVSDLSSNDVVCIYFTTEENAACEKVSKQLVELQKVVHKSGGHLGVVLAAPQIASENMDAYRKSSGLHCPAVKLSSKSELLRIFRYAPAPTLIVLGSNGNVITLGGVMDLDFLEGDKPYTKWLRFVNAGSYGMPVRE